MNDKFIFRFVAGISAFVFLVVFILSLKIPPEARDSTLRLLFSCLSLTPY